jgi:hypothetical protein
MARIAVVRTDVGSIMMADLEPVSQWAVSVEPKGQERNIRRPDPATASNSIYSTVAILLKDSNALTAAQAAATAPLLIARGIPTTGAVVMTAANLNFNYHGVNSAAFDFASHNMDTATYNLLMDELCPGFVETGVFQLSFDHGVIAGFRKATYTAKGVTGAAIQVVADDGTTAYHIA